MSENAKEKETDEKEKETSERKKIADFIETVKPLLLVENFFGIFRFGTTEAGFVPTNWKMKLAGILLITVYTVLYLALLDIPRKVALVDVIDQIPAVVIVVQYIAAVLSTQFFLCDTTIKIFMAFIQLDSVLHINLNEDFYKRSRSLSIRYLILLLVVHTIFTLIDQLTDEELMLGKLVTMALYFEQDLELYLFCEMVVMLRRRLNVINEYLTKFVHDKDSNKTPIFIVNEKEGVQSKQFNFIGRISPNNTKIRDLAEMYDVIGNNCYLINDVFKFQVFMNLVSTFVYIVVTIWTSLYYIRSPNYVSGSLLTVANWCILSVLSVVVMSFTCESLLTTRNKTKLLINEIIMDYDLPRNMRIQAKVFMELIDAWPLRIYVYDMFSVDIKLMLKFVSVATTYLIVIIQISHFV